MAERDDRRLRRAFRRRGSRSQCREEEEERNDTRRETSGVGISVSRGSRVHTSLRWKLAAACSLLSLSLSLSFAFLSRRIARRKNKQVCCVLIRGRGGGREGVAGGKDERARARRESSTRTGSEGGKRGSFSAERDDWEIRRMKERRASSWL